MPTPTSPADTKSEVNPEETKAMDSADEDNECQNETLNTTSDGNTTGPNKRHRRRKKKLYDEICKQLEFYFSDANVTKNRLMHEIVVSSEYVDLNKFLSFNKMQKMTSKVEDLQKALSKSEKLVLSEDKTGVKRKIPFDPLKLKDEATIEECTIYVENVPRHVDHMWLETIFQVFGPIAYISLPKFKHNGQPKGFAFVEYESPESSSRCLEAYGQQGACLPNDLDPSQLQSIQTFEDSNIPQQSQNKNEMSDPLLSPEFREDSEASGKKKRKLEDDENEIKEKKVKLEKAEPTEEHVKPPENEIPSSKPTASENIKKKKKRKHNKTKKTTEEKLESESIKLRVLPKKKWRQLRSRYLNLQRENMAKLKRQLRQCRNMECHNNFYAPSYDNYQYKQSIQYQSNVTSKPKSKIVKINLSTPSESVEVFKKQIFVDLAGQGQGEYAGGNQGFEFVKYVDYDEGNLEAYIRLDANPTAEELIREFVQKAGRVFKSVELLSEKEGDEYWQLVKQTHKKKKQNKSKKPNRGRDRLLLAASKSNHVHFDEETSVVESK